MDFTPRILIVDDEPAIRYLLSTAFTMAGYDVQTASDGPEAMELCPLASFDVVLTDVVMPRMNGHELAQWISDHYPQTRTVLMSGFDAGCQNCPMAGRCVILEKPFRPSEAVSAVEKILAAP